MVLIDSWAYDLMVSGEIVFESEVTNFPVERDSDISDHIRNHPIQLTLEVIVSDSPLEPVASDDSRRVDDVTTAVFGSDQVPLPSAEAYERLLAIRDEKRLVPIEIPVASRSNPNIGTLSTVPGSALENPSPQKFSKRLFNNMALTHLTDRHDKETGGGMFFTATFQQVRFVDNKRVTVRTATPGGKPKTNSKATTGKEFKYDERVLWRLGNPPGGPLEPDYLWAGVAVKWGDGKGGPNAHARYYYTGESNMTLVFSQKPTAGTELNAAAFAAYRADINREAQQFLNDQREALTKRREQIKSRQTIDFISENPNSEAAKARNLPEGVDLSRFQSQPGPTVYGSPESQRQILQPNTPAGGGSFFGTK